MASTPVEWQDLVIGVPGEENGGVNGAGGMAILYGFRGGLSASRNGFLDESGFVGGLVHANDRFGSVFAPR
jgi:hypothetical protein